MRFSCPLLFLATAIVALALPDAPSSKTWYVAPAGDDTASGSMEQPFASVQRAQEAVSAGDTVFIRGGTYRMQESQVSRRRRLYARITVLDKSGTAEKPITYRAYQDEKPVFDCSEVKPPGMRVSAFHVTGSWLRLIGLEVTGVQVTLKVHTQSICFESDGSHNVFEQLRMHDGQAIGIYHLNGSDNLFLNCDAWNNWDYTSEDQRGGNVDGFGCHPVAGGTGNIFRGCRAWFNSDDGYDCLGAMEPVTFENCWAFYNGFSTKFERLHDGNGFKGGGYGARDAKELPDPIPRHVVRFCVAVRNKQSGFYANHHPGGCDWINNTAFNNGTNFNMLCRLEDNVTDVPGFGHKLLNNLGYGPRSEVSNLDVPKCELSNNSFSSDLKLDAKDFKSLDENELLRPRQKNGDLPVIELMHPAEKSELLRMKPAMGAFGK